MTQAEKERAVEEAYHSGAANPFLFKTGGGGAGGTASMEDEPHKDPLLRFVTATRGTVTKEDLGQQRWAAGGGGVRVLASSGATQLNMTTLPLRSMKVKRSVTSPLTPTTITCLPLHAEGPWWASKRFQGRLTRGWWVASGAGCLRQPRSHLERGCGLSECLL